MEIYFHENFEFKELLLKAFYYGIIKRPIINYSLSNRNDSFQILCFIISHIFNSFACKMANDQPTSISFDRLDNPRYNRKEESNKVYQMQLRTWKDPKR